VLSAAASSEKILSRSGLMAPWCGPRAEVLGYQGMLGDGADAISVEAQYPPGLSVTPGPEFPRGREIVAENQPKRVGIITFTPPLLICGRGD
jgi:hypothetical protein